MIHNSDDGIKSLQIECNSCKTCTAVHSSFYDALSEWKSAPIYGRTVKVKLTNGKDTWKHFCFSCKGTAWSCDYYPDDIGKTRTEAETE